MVQAYAYGAKVVAIEGNFDDALRVVRELGRRPEFAIVNSINPDRIAGQKTAAFEIIEELRDAPDFHLLPVGNAGNITAYWTGISRVRRCRQGNEACRRCSAFKPLVPPRFFMEKLSIIQRPSHPRSGLGIRRAGMACDAGN